MYLKTMELLFKPQIVYGLVREAGEAQQNKLFCSSYSKSYNEYTNTARLLDA